MQEPQGQKMGSALLKRYQAQTIRGSGGIANKAVSSSLFFPTMPSGGHFVVDQLILLFYTGTS